MSRGRDGEMEQERVKRDEIANTRPAGKTGSGAANFEKEGYGNYGMQQNRKDMPADKHGI